MLKELKNKLLNFRKEKAEQKFNQWQIEKEILQNSQTIKEEKYEIKNNTSIKKNSFSKKLMIFLFANFSILEIFTGWVTIHSFVLASQINTMPDFTPLVTLLSAVLGETISYGIYCSKAKAENTKGGITYDAIINSEQAVG